MTSKDTKYECGYIYTIGQKRPKHKTRKGISLAAEAAKQLWSKQIDDL